MFKSNAGVESPELGRWLGVSHRTGPLLSYWILPASGIPISCNTVQRLTNLEQSITEMKEKMEAFTESANRRLETTSGDLPTSQNEIPSHTLIGLQHEDEDFIEEYNRVIDSKDLLNIEDNVNDLNLGGQDNYIGMEIGLPRGEDGALEHAIVKRRKIDAEGNPIGKSNPDIILDSRQYDVEFLNGDLEVFTANTIAENLLAQVDEEGHRQLLIDEIIDHRTLKDAIPMSEGTFKTKHGAIRKKRTTRGWELCVRWKGGSTDWITLKDLKDSYPIELAEYAAINKINEEPAFAWWVPYVIKKRQSIISKIKSKYWQRTHKYGIRIPKTMAEAERLDKENGDTLWMDSIRQEMTNNRIAFELHEGEISQLVGFKEITGHLVFDVKLGENFRRKARYCADGHKTDAPSSVTYSTVVSRDSVRIMLLIASLNELDVLSGDVQNAYLTAPNREKVWIRAREEFGVVPGCEGLVGKILIVKRALYGLKSAGASFRAFMAQKLDDMEFKSSVGDPDVWMRPATKPDGEEYYEYILVYVDDIIAISHKAKEVMDEITDTFKFKNDKVSPSDTYLGARLNEKSINGRKCWTMTSVDYFNAAIKNIEATLKHNRWKLPKKVTTPMTTDYSPELDGTPELDADDTQYYQELIGMLRWGTEIGRVDILHEIAILSQYQASPREGHMEQLLHIWAFLKKNPKLTLYFDPARPVIDYSLFKTNKEDFKEQYRDAEEELPHRMPRPRGRPVSTTAFVDASHASNKKTRRSHTGYLIFINRAPVMWYSKRQQTVEASTFSSEFIAMKACIEAIQHLRFKLRMFGVPMDKGHATNIFCDNESVVNNSTKLESVLNKKHNSIAYHYTRWNCAAGVVTVAWISSKENLADPFTKRLSAPVREYLFGNWTY